MIHAVKSSARAEMDMAISGVIARYGAVRVLWRAVRALLSRKPARRAGSTPVSGHLRRDIGLPPQVEMQRHWDLFL